jgi:hypothetical protein
LLPEPNAMAPRSLVRSSKETAGAAVPANDMLNQLSGRLHGLGGSPPVRVYGLRCELKKVTMRRRASSAEASS